jgi:hypothetical protein
MSGTYSGGYNTTHVVNKVPCGPAGSLVSLNDPDSFDRALAADGMCMQWFMLASYQECERLNRQAERAYAQTQMWSSVAGILIEKIDEDNGSRYSNRIRIERPRQTHCRMPMIQIPRYR